MKNLKQILTITFGCFIAFVAYSQEFDDMYFNSKDRAKVNEGKISADLGFAKKSGEIREANAPINPTDSYSARNINPEYSTQLNSETSPVVEDNYFIQDFRPTGVNQNLSNCNCESGSYYNPYYGNGNNAWNNPYYGNMGGFGGPYSSYYSSPWGYPSYGGFNSGLSMSMGYGWGGYNPGLYSALGYGYGSNFWNPYSNPWRNGYYGGYSGSYYPGQVIIINNGDTGGTRVSYSKRSSRSSSINNTVENSRPPSSMANVNNTGRSTINSGRTRSASPEYYDSGWKRTQNANNNTVRDYWNNSNSGGTNSSTRSVFDRNNSNSGGRQGSSGFSTPTRSSFGSGGVNSGGSRSGSSGSSSGSKTRGRGN